MSVDSKNDKPTVLELFQKMHEEKSHSTDSYSLSQPKDPGEFMREMMQEKNTNDVYAGRTWTPAMVINNQESTLKDPSIGDRGLVGGHNLVYTATGDKSIAVRCLTPQNTLRHPTSVDDAIIRQYPKFTCDMNTLNSIPPVGSIVMVMWNNSNIRKGGIILGYAVGGQKQEDDFSIFAAPDACGEVVPSKMRTTHAAGESLPAENKAVETETKVEGTVQDEKEVESLVGAAAPNSRWATTDTPASGSSVEPKEEKKKNEQTPAEVPNTVAPPEEEYTEEIVCNKSYTLGETTEQDRTPPGALPSKYVSSADSMSNKDCNIFEIAKQTKMPPRLVKAFMMIESGRLGARAQRFEAHIFLGVAGLSNIVYPVRKKGRRDLRGKISYTPRGPRGTHNWYISRLHKESNRAAFRKAYALDKKIAIQSTSFGVFQVMGHTLLRIYGDRGRNPDKAIQAYNANPQKVSDGLFIAWYKRKPNFKRAVKDAVRTGKYDWVRLAKSYNGDGSPLSNKRSYASKLKKAWDSLEGVDTFCQDGVPKNNPRPKADPPREGPLTIDMWIRGKNKGPIPAVETRLRKGNLGLMAASLEEPIKRMKAAYKREVPGGAAIKINSLYRSYDEQLAQRRQLLKKEWRAEYARRGGRGNPRAEKWLANIGPQKKYFRISVARPGSSNHNSGIAVDFQTSAGGGQAFKRRGANYRKDRFYDHRAKERRYKGKPAHNWRGTRNDSAQPWRWLALNAHRFGFIRTVASERWHFVYVGQSAATKRFSKINKTHGSWDGLYGQVPAREKARRRRETQARRRESG